ncbi:MULTISPECIES: rhodanese-like domain-containing protein [unclassified Corynebacterium]|uniref:rhodanese-like domain-containing protein n=1 Tax=unclassified Corynebacterium TaxID=2624378 RepID=UPI002A920CE7|nr:rhodanese-like domain-containing protein [Corynebacterium sp.]MDY5786518.1 rhodanese-like domain-containing protein [Corynebacterium sp.]
MRGSMALLDAACSRIRRLTPREAYESSAMLIDVRTAAHRAHGGDIPGAIVIDLTVLPWRLDPTFAWRIPEATSWDTPYVLICRHGFSSAVATDLLQQMGLTDVADVDGGFEAWVAEGLPVAPADYVADVRE